MLQCTLPQGDHKAKGQPAPLQGGQFARHSLHLEYRPEPADLLWGGRSLRLAADRAGDSTKLQHRQLRNRPGLRVQAHAWLLCCLENCTNREHDSARPGWSWRPGSPAQLHCRGLAFGQGHGAEMRYVKMVFRKRSH